MAPNMTKSAPLKHLGPPPRRATAVVSPPLPTQPMRLIDTLDNRKELQIADAGLTRRQVCVFSQTSGKLF